MRVLLIAAALAAAWAAPAMAEPVDEKAARKALFKPGTFDVVYKEDSGLTDEQLGFFRIIVKGRESRDQFGRLAHYYGAIAISPSVFEDGPAALLADPQNVPFRFETGLHSVQAAEVVALRACNALVQAGQKPCVVPAQILPRRYKERGLTLSTFATEGFKAYRDAGGPKAFAASAETRAYGMADGDAAEAEALAACNATAAKVGKPDCKIVIVDSE